MIDGKELTFNVSGLLWHQSLVMYDRPTGSYWSHLLGESISGELKGTRLKHIESMMTDWSTWRQLHPKGSVMVDRRTAQGYHTDFYARLETFVLGIADKDKSKSWSFDQLAQTPVGNDTWNGEPIVVVFDQASVTARMFKRRLGDQVLTFELQDGQLIDNETGSRWHGVAGRAIGGKLKGKSLVVVPEAIVSMRDAWEKFHPSNGDRSHLVRPDIRVDEDGKLEETKSWR